MLTVGIFKIDSNLDALGGAAGRLNGLAKATNKELEEQNELLETVNLKVSCLIPIYVERLEANHPCRAQKWTTRSL